MKPRGRAKTAVDFIGNKSRRHKTFSKRRAGVMKSAKQLATLTGTEVLVLVAYEEMGQVHQLATDKLRPVFTSKAGRALMRSCLGPVLDPTSPSPSPPPPPRRNHGEPTDVSPVMAVATGLEKKVDTVSCQELGSLRSRTDDESKQSLTSLPGSSTTSNISAHESNLLPMLPLQEVGELQATVQPQHSQVLVPHLLPPMEGLVMMTYPGFPPPPPLPPHTVMYDVSYGPYTFRASQEELTGFAMSMTYASPVQSEPLREAV